MKINRKTFVKSIHSSIY